MNDCVCFLIIPSDIYYPIKSWNRKFQTPKHPSIIPVSWNLEYPCCGDYTSKLFLVAFLLGEWGGSRLQKSGGVNSPTSLLSYAVITQGSAQKCNKIIYWTVKKSQNRQGFSSHLLYLSPAKIDFIGSYCCGPL